MLLWTRQFETSKPVQIDILELKLFFRGKISLYLSLMHIDTAIL